MLRIDMDNRFDNNFLVLHVMYTWILRHSGWLLNRFCVRRSGDTTFRRYKGRIYGGEMCDFFECVLFKVLSPDGVKLDNQFCSDVWIGKTSKGEGHLMVMMYGSVGRWKNVQSIFVGIKFELMILTLFLNNLQESVFFVIV